MKVDIYHKMGNAGSWHRTICTITVVFVHSYRDERRQYITRLINIYKSNCYISHTFIIFPYKLIIYIEISKFCCNLLCYFLLRQSCWNNLAQQHHQEEITQYIAYTMPKQNLNSYNKKINEEFNFSAIYCVISYWGLEPRQTAPSRGNNTIYYIHLPTLPNEIKVWLQGEKSNTYILFIYSVLMMSGEHTMKARDVIPH